MAKKIALQVRNALLEAIDAGGDMGAPEGILYAGLMQVMSLDTFNTFMSILKESELITVSGHLARLTAKGKELLAGELAAAKKVGA